MLIEILEGEDPSKSRPLDADRTRFIRDSIAKMLKGYSVAFLSGICRVCGCTDDNACEEGCIWVDKEHTLCSTCGEPQ